MCIILTHVPGTRQQYDEPSNNSKYQDDTTARYVQRQRYVLPYCSPVYCLLVKVGSPDEVTNSSNTYDIYTRYYIPVPRTG